ncbi:hypothetical protein JHK87_049982 [Glycine soja]|nr:hypothetical protein JHK87_049982 [Glycine soja]
MAAVAKGCDTTSLELDKNTLPLQLSPKKLFVVDQLNHFSSQSKGTLKESCKETSQKMKMAEVETLNNKCKKRKFMDFSNTWRLWKNTKL